MFNILPFGLLLSITIDYSLALPDFGVRKLGLPRYFRRTNDNSNTATSGINYNPDGTPFLWLPQDEYSGKTFFE